MSIVIELPSTLRAFASGEDRVAIEGETTIEAAIRALVARHPRLESRLVMPSGGIYDFVGIFVNDCRMSGCDRSRRALRDGDVVSFVPAMAGG